MLLARRREIRLNNKGKQSHIDVMERQKQHNSEKVYCEACDSYHRRDEKKNTLKAKNI